MKVKILKRTFDGSNWLIPGDEVIKDNQTVERWCRCKIATKINQTPENMNPRELFIFCKSKDIKVKPNMEKDYYLKMLKGGNE